MNRSSPKMPITRADILKNSQLGQICGSQRLFRERYEILQVLGTGGFGVTFLARDAVLPGNPFCVIKQLCPHLNTPSSWKRACWRFEKEAKTLAKLGSHSQIPMLVDYFEAQGEFYLVQEYIRGNTLAQQVKGNGSLSEVGVKRFLQELLPLLHYIHQHRVIHRDIKPQNLLRCQDDGRLVLIDFGAVKEELVCVGESEIDQNTNTNFVGTMGFAPPEQLSLRPVYSSDIYAVGVTCLYLLTGKMPLEFQYDSQTGEICWQKEVNVSQHFTQILDKMLKISLEERFKSAQDVIWALDMESYLPTLTNCLTTQRLGVNSQTAKEEISQHQGYLSPLTRTANVIRERRARLQARKLHGGSLNDS
jgi:serine/threonine protein kinase